MEPAAIPSGPSGVKAVVAGKLFEDNPRGQRGFCFTNLLLSIYGFTYLFVPVISRQL